MFTKRTIQPHRPVEHTDTAVEALAVSMNERARVDLPYMAQLCGKDKAEIATELQGVGITANYSGFFYTSYAVYLAARQPERLLLVTKWLYPEVAEQYHKAWKNVERGISSAACLRFSRSRAAFSRSRSASSSA